VDAAAANRADALADRVRANFRAELVETTRERDELQSRVGALSARVSELQSERARLVEQLQAIRASKSWRVTAPLRATLSVLSRRRP
jgi:uncharacterized coiled-coil DUF342 family protein